MADINPNPHVERFNDDERVRRIQQARHLAEAERDEARAEAERLRETNRRLNRRCQQADAALAEWADMQKGAQKGQSIGRALAAYGFEQASRERDAANALLREVRTFFGTGDADDDLVERIEKHLDAGAGGEM